MWSDACAANCAANCADSPSTGTSSAGWSRSDKPESTSTTPSHSGVRLRTFHGNPGRLDPPFRGGLSSLDAVFLLFCLLSMPQNAKRPDGVQPPLATFGPLPPLPWHQRIGYLKSAQSSEHLEKLFTISVKSEDKVRTRLFP